MEPLEWFLLTSLPVRSQAQAWRVLQWYRLRWRIEDWHRILKSGCKVEYLGHRTGERIERAVTIKPVIAWRLAALTLLGRETPELPATVFFTQMQLRVLRHFAAKRQLGAPDNLGLAVRAMVILGGLCRPNARPRVIKRSSVNAGSREGVEGQCGRSMSARASAWSASDSSGSSFGFGQ